MNKDREVTIPYNQMPITVSLRAIDRKVWRDVYCVECGRPYMSISDKFATIIDAAFPVQMMRGNERLLGIRCRNHYCKQHYNVYV